MVPHLRPQVQVGIAQERQPEQLPLGVALLVLPRALVRQELGQVLGEPKAEPEEPVLQGQQLQRASQASAGQMREVARSCLAAWELDLDIHQVPEHQKQGEDIERAVRKPEAAAENWEEPESSADLERQAGHHMGLHRPVAFQAGDNPAMAAHLVPEPGELELLQVAPLPALKRVDLDGMDQGMTFRATHQDFKSFSLVSKSTQRAIQKQARVAVGTTSKSQRWKVKSHFRVHDLLLFPLAGNRFHCRD